MSLEDDLSKFERQVNNFSIAGAAGSFHTGFSIGDDARGSGSGVHRARIGPTPEDRISFLEQSFKNFTIRGGHDISVTGSLVAGGFAISTKTAPSGEGTGGGGPGPTPTGACCIGADCFALTSDDCATMGGTYQGDGVSCVPNPCVGACCHDDGSCTVTTEAGCVGVGAYQGSGTVCDPNPCASCQFNHTDISSITIDVAITANFNATSGAQPCMLNFTKSGSNTWTRVDRNFASPVDPGPNEFQLWSDCFGNITILPTQFFLDVVDPMSNPCGRTSDVLTEPDDAYGSVDITITGGSVLIAVHAAAALNCTEFGVPDFDCGVSDGCPDADYSTTVASMIGSYNNSCTHDHPPLDDGAHTNFNVTVTIA